VSSPTTTTGDTTTTTTGSASSSTPPPTPTPAAWTLGILSGLGAPTNNTATQNLLMAWQQVEGQWGATGAFNAAQQNNPLNIESTPTQGYSGPAGKQICDSAGNCTLAFPTPADGLAATIAFIQQYQPAIAKALIAGDVNAFLAAVAGWNPGSPGYSNNIATAFGSPTLAVAWLKDLQQAAGLGLGLFGGVAGGIAAVKDTLTFVEDVTTHILDPAWWKRLALGAAGVALFVVGLAVFLSTTQEGEKAVSEGESAAPLVAGLAA
jgi:hypothetical protein